MKAQGPRVSVVGATGMVGQELLLLLERRRFPLSSLSCFSSGREPKKVRFRGKNLPAAAVDRAALFSSDLVFLVSSDEVSRGLGRKLAARGIWVIDDSAAFRLDPSVPLVIPEVNASSISKDSRLIAGPNCTMTGLAVAGHLLERSVGVVAARVASYQAVSGAGKDALDEFFQQNRSTAARLPRRLERAPLIPSPRAAALPRPIALNVIPQVGGFDAGGNTGEETKVAAELRKIWRAPNLKISVTAVRVPVIRGHSLAVWLTLGKALAPAQTLRILRKTPGLVVCDGDDYPTPLSAAGRWPVYAGRVRAGSDKKEICLWIVSDNLLKGAALNSVQIAEYLLGRKWLVRR